MSELLRIEHFTMHSGAPGWFKIECDALTSGDWSAAAAMAAKILPPFGEVEGVPRGGLLFAYYLRQFARPEEPEAALLIADDVLTTGGSMRTQRGKRKAIGVVLFARGPSPKWVTPLFTLHAGLQDG